MDSNTGNRFQLLWLVQVLTNPNVHTRQKVHEHIGRRRGTEQVTSSDPAHKASCRQGRDTAAQTLPLHPAFALAGHSSLPQPLGNCFRESSCALNRTSTYWLTLLQGNYWGSLNKTAFIRSDRGRNMLFFPLFPQCLLQWHNALSQAQTSHTHRSTTTPFSNPLKNLFSLSWDLALAQESHSIMSIHAQRLSSNTSIHCKCKISIFLAGYQGKNLLHHLTFPALRLYLKPLKIKWLLKPCNTNYLEALKSYPKSKWELQAPCSIQE